MKAFSFVALGSLLIALGFGYAAVRLNSRNGSGPDTGVPTSQIVFGGSHKVTPKMIATTNEMIHQSAPGFQAQASDGKSYVLDDLSTQGPLVIIFIKDGCPCSLAAQPFYNRLHEAYGSHIRFIGVIDANIQVAQRWSSQNRSSYPILCDPGLKIVNQYKATNSAYFAVVAQDGTIEKYWPGYSAKMLLEASAHLARLAKIDIKPIDLTDAPDELYTGCPY